MQTAHADLLTIPQAAAEFGVNPWTLRKWIARKRLNPHDRIPCPGGTMPRVTREAVQAAIDVPSRRGDNLRKIPRQTA